jgi:HPt (histidine-containing phosphotransfer) domain-containing protein
MTDGRLDRAGSDDAIDRPTFDRLLDMAGGDREFVDDLVDTYLEDGAAHVEGLRAAAAADDAAAIVRPAHTLKSSSATVGALRLADLCRQLEADGRAGTVPDAAERAEATARAFGDVRTALLELRDGASD